MRNFLVALAVFLIVIIGLGTIVVRIFNRNPDPGPGTSQTAQKGSFADKTNKVRFTTDGAIVGPESHRAIRISIDPSGRTLEILKGYDGEVIRQHSFDNEESAYKQFLIAIDKAGYTRENPNVTTDEKGTCPLGIRFIYEATYSSDKPLRLWSANCTVGRMQGNIGTIQQLFKNQIPDYNKLVAGINLTKP